MTKRRKIKYIRDLPEVGPEFELCEYRGLPALREKTDRFIKGYYSLTIQKNADRKLIGFLNRSGEFQFFYPCYLGCTQKSWKKKQPARKKINLDGTWTTVNKDRNGRTTSIRNGCVYHKFIMIATDMLADKILLGLKV